MLIFWLKYLIVLCGVSLVSTLQLVVVSKLLKLSGVKWKEGKENACRLRDKKKRFQRKMRVKKGKHKKKISEELINKNHFHSSFTPFPIKFWWISSLLVDKCHMQYQFCNCYHYWHHYNNINKTLNRSDCIRAHISPIFFFVLLSLCYHG